MGTIKSIKVNGQSYSLDNSGVTTSIDSSVDFAIADEDGNEIFVLDKGHIITKNFDSRKGSEISYLVGKRVAFLGDSITQGASATHGYAYHDIFCKLCGAIDRTTEIYDAQNGKGSMLGMNGTCIANNTKNGLGSSRFVTRATAEKFADSKLIVVFGGTNDLSYDSKPIGEHFVVEEISATGNMGTKHLSAPVDTDTFAGALHELIITIQTVCPQTPIVFMTPMKRDHNSASNPDYLTCNKNGDFMIDYVNAIKDICAFYSIPVLDLYSDSQLNPLSIAWKNWFGDGLHPGNKGHAYIGNLLYKFVRNNVVFPDEI